MSRHVWPVHAYFSVRGSSVTFVVAAAQTASKLGSMTLDGGAGETVGAESRNGEE